VIIRSKVMEKNKPNCWDTNDVLMAKYHDDEWVYRERGHRRLAARTFHEKCWNCIWGCRSR
jgi:hypothetical protein